ncbi:hypothetical protein DC498_10930 [Terrimonas sp.]|uniref:MauE/DoxX family redox-associated membrane protein n=1 Tax=Terrimonas sp. TaxID=1914338 RepID=UPI000D52164B|nr:MauE/DoxX family redox-associated membrane protein [Terrimonas sp.]PVD52229.1 hypothetical protein DC498_10930 [Terrimonas sp.]
MISCFKQVKITEIATAVFIILYTYTAVNKIIDYRTFKLALVQSPVLVNHANFIAITIPIVELFVVGLLVFSNTRAMGLFFSLILITVFTLYISCLILFARELPCNCGGIMKALSWKQHLLVNIILIVLAAWAWIIAKTNKNIIAINRNS